MFAIATETTTNKFIPKLSIYAGVVLAAAMGFFGLKAHVPASASTPNSNPPAVPDQAAGKKLNAKSDAEKKRHLISPSTR